jgi:hypothetical protein
MTSASALHPGLRAVALAQRGVFTATQAYAFRHTQKELQRLRAAGLLLSVRRGIYVESARWADANSVTRLRIRTVALSLALSAPAVLSHQSAAAELGMELLEPTTDSCMSLGRTDRVRGSKQASIITSRSFCRTRSSRSKQA